MAKKAEKVKEHFLSVSYPLRPETDLDSQIMKIASHLAFEDDGSGAGFGQRDLEFCFIGTKTQFIKNLKMFKDSLKDIEVTFSK